MQVPSFFIFFPANVDCVNLLSHPHLPKYIFINIHRQLIAWNIYQGVGVDVTIDNWTLQYTGVRERVLFRPVLNVLDANQLPLKLTPLRLRLALKVVVTGH